MREGRGDKSDGARWVDDRGEGSKKFHNQILANMQAELGKLELSIKDLEQEVESLQKDLIKASVSFLNILNH
ncbi:hypothetical protein DITRI_Ditri08aG0148200 [Diplodiscus trichospermus]